MLRKIVYLISIFCFSAGFSISQTTESTQTDKQKVPIVVSSNKVDDKISLIEGKVVVVYDGDTLSIETKDRQIYSIRLQGIDAPEDKQNYSKKSRKTLIDLLLGKDVKVIVHKKDLYDRYIGNVYFNGQDVGLKQIETGMAWHFKQYIYEQTLEERKRYAQAELKAKAERLGLWEDKDPTPPWVFRGDKTTTPARNKETVKKQDTADSKNISVNRETTTNSNKSSGREYILGPRGGCYYINANGRKVYVKDKSLCDQ